jgi:hypothetical protein
LVGPARTLASAALAHNQNISKGSKTLETLQTSTAGVPGKVKLQIRVKSLKMGYHLLIFCKNLEKSC